MTTDQRTDQADPPAHEPVPLRPRPTTVVAEWEPGTFVENLAPGPADDWFVTIPSHQRVDHVSAEGRTETVAELSRPVTGIVTDGGACYLLSGPLGEPGWRLLRLGPAGEGYPVSTVCELPDLIFGNGMTWAGRRLLIADSVRGLVLALDPRTGATERWLEHEWLTKTDPATQLPGVNGIAVHAGQVYLTSTERALVLGCPLQPRPSGPRVLAGRLRADDLTVGADGRIYLATHDQNSVLCLAPDGSRVDIAGAEQGATGCTAVAFDAGGRLYASTTGGIFNPRDGVVEAARLLRITV
ncbi:SMP-30/gluconolactonase/LRE family protein [Amycolatopsis aidingensis]|uniref:SMP-30/gluconolactonase/LRE family protein n=1 Tax=Amycolatopsis aidingensis TaxID=2842453 RepID=UPI001C0E2C0F|nr:hypothetical protein [Amycolatopsis aidingensis]